MTWILWRKLLRDIRWAFLIMFCLLLGFELFWVLVTKRVTTEFSPLFRGLANRLSIAEDSFQKHFFSGPGKVMQSIMGGENIRFNQPQDMLAVGYLHPLIQTIFCLWAIGRAAGAIAGEIDKGTMELLLAQPLARSRILLAHLLVDLTVLPLLALAVWLGTMTGSQLAGPFLVNESTFEMFTIKIPIDSTTLKIFPESMFPSIFNIMALLFAISGYTMWLSAHGRFRNRVIGFAVLITLIQFVINVLGQMWDGIAWLRPFTVFYYYQPQSISLHNQWTINTAAVWGDSMSYDLNVLAILVTVGLFGYLMAWRTFSRRDIPAPL